MTDEQKAARVKALQACEEILSSYLTDWLSEPDDPDSDDQLVDGHVEGFEHVDPEVDDIRDTILLLENETCG